ncbi:hypothetical protein BDZ97DRAFT_1766542 [Flammula alnicola]|nr:hypothetical protein BDZ97DRAFT_1766529 [Flammula alnicola]KAF8954166.1 hypothetical protein BDZ97DRAFT_1766532 [Flammula alnicola]KAF8954176.1 hypothetical protein BDZ97DRAFT_1766542 [Flammula alnicola]
MTRTHQKRTQLQAESKCVTNYSLFATSIASTCVRCETGRHQLSIEECQADGGKIRATCRACLTRHQGRTAAATLAQEQAATLTNYYEGAAADDEVPNCRESSEDGGAAMPGPDAAAEVKTRMINLSEALSISGRKSIQKLNF